MRGKAKYNLWDKEEETRIIYEVDINCNSSYILEVILRVSEEICSA